jgi:hypothetical protein
MQHDRFTLKKTSLKLKSTKLAGFLPEALLIGIIQNAFGRFIQIIELTMTKRPPENRAERKHQQDAHWYQ